MKRKILLNSASLLHPQQGAVLIVGLVILLLMTMIGVTAMQGVIQQGRMTGNLREHNIAIQAGEAALREAERYLLPLRQETTRMGATYADSIRGDSGHIASEMNKMAIDPLTWTDSNSVQLDSSFATHSAGMKPYASPRLHLERWKTVPRGGTIEVGMEHLYEVHRATVLGYGGNASLSYVLQSTHIRTHDSDS